MSTQATFELNKSCEELLTYPYATLCYSLNDKCYQIGDVVYGQHSTQSLNYRIGKLGDTNGVNWSRRSYFQNALAKPMEIQNTRPYLSLSSGQLCSTLSIAIPVKGGEYMFCVVMLNSHK